MFRFISTITFDSKTIETIVATPILASLATTTIRLQGLVRQKIEGSGTAFLGATGTIVQKVLAENEVMLMDTNCILAYASTCTFDLKKTGGIVNWIGGGEGFFNSSLKGPGLVIVQSMNMCMLLESLAAEKMYRR